jgi:metal-sulfur cluster biosynthetic enzyme
MEPEHMERCAGGTEHLSSGIAVEALSVQQEEVVHILNEILDPCSVAAGTSIGLVEMGMIDTLEVCGDAVSVGLLPTVPGCIYSGVFANEITRRLKELSWCGEVEVKISVTGVIWDEDRMSANARKRLEVARRDNRSRVALSRR